MNHQKIHFWLLTTIKVISIIAGLIGIGLIIFGLQSCSGDGCMIRFLIFIGFPLLIVAIIIFLITSYVLKKIET